MKTRINVLLIVALSILLCLQCKKKKDEPTTPTPEPTPTNNPNTLSDLFALNGSPTNTISVSATTASTVNIGGITIEIPANAFVTQSSGTITGNVILAVKTILNKGEIILSGAAANSSNSRLISTKGCVKITPSQNSQSLRLSSSGTVFVDINDGVATPPPMKKYYTNKLSVSDSTKIWALEADTNNVAITWNGSNFVHRAGLDSTKWLNVGAEWDNSGTKVAMVIRPDTSGTFNKTNCAVYLSIDGSLTVGACYEISSSYYRISNIPMGKNVHIIGVGVINGQYYSSISATSTSSGTLTLNMQPKTMQQIKNDLALLP